MNRKSIIAVAAAVLPGLSGYALSASNTEFEPRMNPVDIVRDDAPELAEFGEQPIGVTTLEMTHEDQLDLVNAPATGEIPRYDRPLMVEVWYPSEAQEGEVDNAYQVVTRDGETEATLHGRAARDAAATGGPYPLIILSHGYPGNRFLMSHFGENLASKGYVVASIDHTDSTYGDQSAFVSTLYNRSLDQLFVLDQLAALRDDNSHRLGNLIDAENTGIIGYSMGGYGAVNTIGGGLSDAIQTLPYGQENQIEAWAQRRLAADGYAETLDARIKATIAIAPWGNQNGLWDAEGLANITTPVMVLGGSVDDVSDYANGIEPLYQGLTNADSYLLTFENANHNAAAPIPAPQEVYATGEGFDHYSDAVWDNTRMNNIAQHFATAFFDHYLRGADTTEYFDLVERAEDGVWSLDADGNENSDHTYWRGFPNRSAVGLFFQSDVE